MHRIAILGAGISGLATGWFLKQLLGSDVQLTIIDKNERAGGWIETVRYEDFFFEQGPRSCRTKGMGRETLALIEALGLGDQVITPHSDAKNRFLYNGKEPQRLPKHLCEVPFNSFTQGFLKSMWRDWKMPKREGEDESIHSFFSRRIGTALTETVIDSFVSGIYAGDYKRLSLKSCFPLFDEWEQQHGSLLRGAWHHRPLSSIEQTPFIQQMGRFPLFSFREGLDTLPRTLAERLSEHLVLGQSVNRLKFNKHCAEIELNNGKSYQVDGVISTLPTFALSALLKDYSSITEKLAKLTYASVTSVNIGFRQAVLPFKGFGYLIPSCHGLKALGCVWDSSVFPQQNQGTQTRLTLMIGGSRHPEVAQMSQTEITTLTQSILSDHLGIHANPEVMQIKQSHQAIPQFEIGYAQWKNEIEEEVRQHIPQLIVSGSAWTGVAINDCIAKGRQLAQSIANKLT